MGNKAIKPHPERIERVYELMNRENLSQTKLAEKIGTSQQRVSEFLTTGKISDRRMQQIIDAFPEYFPEWLYGYGDPEIATRQDLAIRNFYASKPLEEDLTDYFAALDADTPLQQLIDKLDQIDPVHRLDVLEMLNKIVEPYTLIPEWRC